MTTKNPPAAALGLQSAPFADDFIDVAGLNAHASQALLRRIDEVRGAAAAGARCPSRALAILGPAGGGKTHLFARLRHHAGPRATLTLLRPFFGLNLTPRDVLASAVDQLCLPVRGSDSTPLELLVGHWLGDAADSAFPGATLEQLRALDATTRASRVDDAVARVLVALPEAAPAAHLARALFSLDVQPRADRWAELAWLSGREPRTTADAAALGEADVLQMLRLLSTLAAPVAPLTLVFDQLENLADDDDARVLGYGNLIAELVDSVESLTIVQLALTSEWMQSIEPRLSLPQKTRLAAQVLLLETPTRAQREQLLRAWQAQLPVTGRRKRFPHPFSVEELQSVLDAPGMTPRLLLVALLRASSGEPAIAPSATPPPRKGGDALAALWAEEFARVRAELDERASAGVPLDAAELAEGLAAALRGDPALEVTLRSERDRVLLGVRGPGHALDVLFVLGAHHASVGGALGKAIELAQSGKVVVLREKRQELPRSWESVHARREAFECLPNARWLWLEGDDAARAVALARLTSQLRAGRLNPELGALTEIDLRRVAVPGDWKAVVALSLWLGDVPRERAERPVEDKPERVQETAAPGKPQEAATPTVREWVRMGRRLGGAIARDYVGRLRGLVRRG